MNSPYLCPGHFIRNFLPIWIFLLLFLFLILFYPYFFICIHCYRFVVRSSCYFLSLYFVFYCLGIVFQCCLSGIKLCSSSLFSEFDAFLLSNFSSIFGNVQILPSKVFQSIMLFLRLQLSKFVLICSRLAFLILFYNFFIWLEGKMSHFLNKFKDLQITRSFFYPDT